ncbi:FAD dependent oxidoreductase [Punctularia strigosozonata HHB-11173 SS5]|uniref:FAD dependent oxidoreductase n=1 Tax=Punctularia strigosozonata (strain HHB-11173) TaxID=741275 RepID=UPI0004417E19|nr:FAD dependent oxidoreductase [Punctularia strigosozonata HHB-11173 SS5]EIN09629.1 FAD dependent oxidoreductase [Punctularia strigosozonata HHB-11173 SS5]
MDPTHRDICIVGGGIIGVCTAYFIVNDPAHDPTRTTVTLIEEHEIAGAASGKAGGFLALDWHGPATQSLAALSYRLHRELAAEFDGESAWGYRAMDSVSISVTAKAKGDILGTKEPEPNTAVVISALRELPGPREGVVDMRWLNPEARRNVCGTKETTAQVHPRLFTKALFSRAEQKGMRFIHGHPERLHRNSDSRPTSLDVTSAGCSTPTTIPCSDLVLTAGPWSAQVAETLGVTPVPHINNLPGHSILIRPRIPISPLAVFAGIRNANTGASRSANGGEITESPELFPRPDGSVYVAGENHARQMPASANEVEWLVDEEMIQRLVRASAQISDALAEGDVEVKQLCYRPRTPDGRPSIGKLNEHVWMAAGHGPWGITLGPGTGKVMAELLLYGQAQSARIGELDPLRSFAQDRRAR